MAGREYGPTAGIKLLRAAVARLYNEHHRKGKSSQYSWENVAIVPGGRAGLIRIAAVLNVCTLSDPSPSTQIFHFTKLLFFSFPVHKDGPKLQSSFLRHTQTGFASRPTNEDKKAILSLEPMGDELSTGEVLP